jgi:hypothetical protein
MCLILLAGCATIIRGTEQDVTVDTVPGGAMVEFSNGQKCTSPCSIAAKRNQDLNVNISKDGCTSQTAFVRPRVSAGSSLLGSLPDYATGAVYNLEPSQLSFMLLCAGSE